MKVLPVVKPVFLRKAGEWCRRQAPTLMSIGAGAAAVGACYLFWKARPTCDDILQKGKAEKEKIKEGIKCDGSVGGVEEVKMTPEDEKKAIRRVNLDMGLSLFKAVGPALGMLILELALIFGANHVNATRIAAITAAYELKTGELTKYKDKAQEIVGEKKAKEVSKAVSQETVNKSWSEDTVVYGTGHGNTLYFDEWSGRFFRSSRSHIEQSFAKISQLTFADMFASLNDLYSYLGLRGIKGGNDMGWYAEYGVVEPGWEGDYVETPEGEQAIVLHYDLHPRHNWGDM